MRRFTRTLLITVGTLSVALGAIGMFLPLLPTTPFLLLGAFCYSRSSDKFYTRLLGNRVCGPYIKNYRERGGITLRQKVMALSVLWLSMANTAWLVAPPLWAKLALFLVASAVTVYLIRLRTVRSESRRPAAS
jgi:uncharacterized membrane protein YbaN (DUF454 family)